MPTRSFVKYRRMEYREVSNYPPYSTVGATMWQAPETRTTGNNKKNWRWLVENGESATTSLTGTREFVFATPGAGKVRYYYSFGSPPGERIDKWEGNYLGYSIGAPEAFDVSLWSPADLRARSQFYKKLREAQIQLSGPTFLGELRESIKMIRHPAETLRRGIGDYFRALSKRRGRGSSIISKRKILADTWLEYSFGWKPLIHDISDGVTAYAAALDDVAHTMIRATGINEQDLGLLTKQANPDFVYNFYTHQRKKFCSVKYMARVENATTGPSGSLERLKNTFGVSWGEFFPTAWELLPYSFFIDYFSNIGDVISASVTSTAGVQWVKRTDRYIGSSVYIGGAHDPVQTKSFCRGTSANYRESSGKLGSLYLLSTKVDRSEVLTPGFPTLSFNLPGTRNQFFNMAALFYPSKKLTPFF